MNIQNMKIADIRPYEKNPRINEGAVDAVAASIKEFGWRAPIVVDKKMVINCGHTRLRSAKMLGLTEVPCIIADNLTPLLPASGGFPSRQFLLRRKEDWCQE